MEKWNDKVAVVTGASSGIGAAVAVRLVECGMVVVGLARRADRLLAIRTTLLSTTNSHRFIPMTCDVTNEASIVDTFADIERQFGRIDVLVNNAGVGHMNSLLTLDAHVLQALFRTNCIGPCLCTREALRIMCAHNVEFGHILFTNSLLGHRTSTAAVDGDASGLHLYRCVHPYAASKRALAVLVEGLRQELRSQAMFNIRVTEVSPGIVATEIADSFHKTGDELLKNQAQSFFKKFVTSKAVMEPYDVADAFMFALSAPAHVDVNEIIVRHNCA